MKKNGFTLTEVIVVIFILMVVTTIAIPGIYTAYNRQNDKKVETTEKVIINAAKTYYSLNSQVRDQLSLNGDYIDVSIQTLAEAELLDLPIIDPTTNQNINTNLMVRIINKSGTIEYQFSIN